MLSLDHPSAFLDRRRYYETYVRYVVFLGLAPAVCITSKRRTLFFMLICFMLTFFGSVNGCILAKSMCSELYAELCVVCLVVMLMIHLCQYFKVK